MISYKNYSIKKKIILLIVLIAITVLFISTIASFYIQYSLLKDGKQIEIDSIASVIAGNSAAALKSGDVNTINTILSGLKNNPSIINAIIIDNYRQIVSYYGNDYPEIDIGNLLINKGTSYFGSSNIVVTKPIVFGNKNIGTVIIAAGLKDLNKKIAQYTVIVLIILVLSILIAYFLSIKFQKIVTNPILHLTDITAKVAGEEDYSISAIKSSNDEIGNLIDNFNKMISQIKSRDDELKKINLELENRILDRTKKLQESLHEKDTLLKEVHHRVKNNLQIICSLLILQSGSIKDQNTLTKFEECRNRIMSMALVHELLYQDERIHSLDLNNYVRALVHNLRNTFELVHNDIKFNLVADQLDDSFISIDIAIPFGLIVNELVSNSVRHAFPTNGTHPLYQPEKQKEINIELYKSNEDQVSLIFKDNGVGLPKDFDFTKSDSLGLQLIVGLVEQIEGTIDKLDQEGTAYEINFNVNY